LPIKQAAPIPAIVRVAGEGTAVIVQFQLSPTNVVPGVEKRLLKFGGTGTGGKGRAFANMSIAKSPSEANAEKSYVVFILDTSLMWPDRCKTDGSASATNPVREV
jgi:hypothetical protein